MDIVKLTPAVKDYIWGGNKLIGWGKPHSGDIIAECWELSFHPDGLSTVDGVPLSDIATEKDLGINACGFGFFPMLIKLIDAKGNLSVQVHPSDAYALPREGQLGKTEMWYILDAEEGAGIYFGFKRDVTRAEYERGISNGEVLNMLNFFPVKRGEHYFISAGTVHAIGAGTTILEIQQNSNLTYRVFDYNRVGADGKPRQLHIAKALEVSNLSACGKRGMRHNEGVRTRIGANKYFTVFEYAVSGQLSLERSSSSFSAFTCTCGSGTINGKTMLLGDTYFVPAGYGKFTLDGTMTVVESTVCKYFASQSNGIITVTDDYGITIGETSADVGLNKLLDSLAMTEQDVEGE